jgi:hypothetical protein
MSWLKPYPRTNLIQGLLSFLVLVSIGYILLFAGLSALRSVYPYELEWIEGASVDEINWIVQGKPLYGEPSISFIPSMKTPLFFYFSAGLAKIFGVGFFAPRLLSIIASLGIFCIVYLIVVNSEAGFAAGILAAGLVAAAFRFTGAWMDLAKTDSLCMFFLLAGFYVGQKYPGRKGWIFSSLFYILAYYTKQLALVVIVLICISSLIDTRGRSIVRWLVTGLVGYGIFILVDRVTNGWFSFYTVDILQYHNWQGAPLIFIERVLKNMWPVILIILTYVYFSFRGLLKDKFSGRNWQNLCLGAALVVASGSVFLKSWTYDNGFIPTVLGIAVLTGIGFDFLVRYKDFATCSKFNLMPKVAVLILLLVQFGLFFYNPIQQLPTEQDRKAGDTFVELLRSLPDKVLVFNHGYYNHLAGKPSYLHSSWIGDVIASSTQAENTSDAQHGQEVVHVLSQAIQTQMFDRIILDNHPEQFLPYYIVNIEPIFEDKYVFYPVTGAHSRPTSILVKNSILRGGSLPLTDPALSRLFAQGWKVENNALFGTAKQSIIQLALEQNHDYQLKIRLTPSCLSEKPLVSSISTAWNGKLLGSIAIDACKSLLLMFDIKQDQIEKRWNQLEFSFETPATSVAGSEDAGQLTATFQEISFVQK